MKKITILLALIAVNIYGLKAQNISQSSTQYNGNIFHMGGNVGIGTFSPLARLDIMSATENLVYFNAGINNTYPSRVQFGISNWSGFASLWNSGSLKTIHISANGNSYFNGGNVGIGTASPSGKLHLVSSDIDLLYTNTTSDINTIWRFMKNSIETGAFFSLAGSTDFNIRASNTTGSLNFMTGGSYNRMYINSNGNVGIGTTTPAVLLQVGHAGSVNAPEMVRISTSYGSNMNEARGGIHWHDETNTTGRIYTIYNGTTVDLRIGSLFNSGYNSNDLFTIKGNGNVGIGTTNPLYKLTVEGTIAAREVKVTAEAWADFVFHPSYKLRTLGEVEQFIKTNSHLPEIPTEAEVKESGISLGEMNAKLLQKVEELTLYMIEQQKVNEKQNQLIKMLEQKIEKITTKQ